MQPDTELIEHGGALWRRLPDDPRWQDLGVAPTPRGQWQVFRYHIWHGLLMHYPLWSIIRFAWSNRDAFND